MKNHEQPKKIQQKMIRIGITGGIGSGKTTVRKLFERLNIPTLDADTFAKDLLKPNKKTLKKLIALIGERYLDKNQPPSDQPLDRKKLRKAFFEDSCLKKKVESFMHPLIRQGLIEKSQEFKSPFCVIEIPLLYETKADYVEKIIVTDCDQDTQVKRVKTRSNLSKTEILNIIQQQATRAQRKSIADWVINTQQPIDKVAEQVDQITQLLRNG